MYFCEIMQDGFTWWKTATVHVAVREKPAFSPLVHGQETVQFPDGKALADLDYDGYYDVVCGQKVIYNDTLSFISSDSIPALYPEVSFPDLLNENDPFIFSHEPIVVDPGWTYSRPSGLIRHRNGIYSQVESDLLKNVATWADFNNDGRLEGVKIIYENSLGTGIFLVRVTEDTITQELVGGGSWALWANCQQRMETADFDKDGDIDIFLIGTGPYGCSWNSATTILKNNGGTFEEIQVQLPPHYHDCYAQWFDADADGDLDLLYSFSIYNDGIYPGSTPEKKAIYIYTNHNGAYELSFGDTVGISTTTTFHPRPRFVELDNDGFFDVSFNNNLYLHSATGYTKIPSGYDLVYGGVSCNSMYSGDMDNDGDQDVLGDIRLFINHNCNPPNSPPGVPTGLSCSISVDTVRFSWGRATDQETPVMGLSYNLRSCNNIT